MAGWGIQSWGFGKWGLQGDELVLVTSVVDSPIAWNSGNFGANNWGGQFNNIGISLGNESVTAEVNNGWGRFTWGENVWGSQAFVIQVTGQQLNLSLNSVTLSANANIDLTGNQLNIAEGEVDPNPDVSITGQQINLTLNSITSIGDANVSVTGQQLNISQGDENIDVSVIVQVSSTYQAGWGIVAWGAQNWGDAELDIAMIIAEGEVDPSPDATVTGIGMTVALAVGTVVIGTGNVALTGQQINISQGTAIGDANTIASVTGIGLNIAVGTVFAGTTSVIPVTGNGLTIALNSINNQIWTEINTGTDATWIEIDTAA
jgi:hypothetical protein